MVAPDLDVRRDEVGDLGIAAPEHHVLTRAFQVIIDELEGTGTIPAADRLRVLALGVTLAQVGVDHGAGGAVERYATLHTARRVAVNVAAVENEVVGDLRERVLEARAVAQEHDAVVEAGGRRDLHADEAVVMRACGGLDRAR